MKPQCGFNSKSAPYEPLCLCALHLENEAYLKDDSCRPPATHMATSLKKECTVKANNQSTGMINTIYVVYEKKST